MNNALVTQERNPYQLMDALDDELIKAELENRIVDTWVYSFSGSDGKPQTGLSKVGVDACCTEMAKAGNVIRENQVTFQKDPTDPEYILFQGMATRFLINQEGQQIEMETVNGTKRQWIKMKSKGKIIDDPFWYEKGAMKALRNARARLIPEEIRTKIVTLAKSKGRIKEIEIPTEPYEKTKDQPNTISEAQRKRFYAIAKKAGKEDDEIKEYLKQTFGIDSTKDIKRDYYEQACEWAEGERFPGEDG